MQGSETNDGADGELFFSRLLDDKEDFPRYDNYGNIGQDIQSCAHSQTELLEFDVPCSVTSAVVFGGLLELDR